VNGTAGGPKDEDGQIGDSHQKEFEYCFHGSIVICLLLSGDKISGFSNCASSSFVGIFKALFH
jgi:hypothetical protein